VSGQERGREREREGVCVREKYGKDETGGARGGERKREGDMRKKAKERENTCCCRPGTATHCSTLQHKTHIVVGRALQNGSSQAIAKDGVERLVRHPAHLVCCSVLQCVAVCCSVLSDLYGIQLT